MTKKGAFYGRVSTRDQAEHGTSLQSQTESGRSYAARNDIALVGEFVEDFSGAILSRPMLNRVRELIRSKSIDVLIVYDQDRLTRSLAHSLLLRDEFERYGIELHTVVSGLSGTTPEAAMQNNLRAMFAEYERAKINERTERGRMQKVKNGIHVQHGKVLYGYEKKDNKIVIRQDQAAIVRKIFDWYVNGLDGKNMGLKAIAMQLSIDKTPTPMHYDAKKARTRVPFMWDTTTVRRIIANESYKGVYRYGKMMGKYGEGGRRKDEDTITLDFPVIICPETWQIAQHRIKENASRARSLKKHNTILSGLCVCGACGYRMIIHRQSSGFAYRCSQSLNRHRGLEHICKQPQVNTRVLEKCVWDKTVQFLTDPQYFDELVKGAMSAERDSLQGRESRLQAISSRIAELKQQISRIAIKLIEMDDSSLMAEALRVQSAKIEDEYRQLGDEQGKLKRSIEQSQVNISSIDELTTFKNLCLLGLDDATAEDKRSIFEKLGLKVVVFDSGAKLSYDIQLFGVSFELSHLREYTIDPDLNFDFAPILFRSYFSHV